MKYLKTFEKRGKDVVLYDNGKVNITLNKNNTMTYNSNYRSCSPVWGLAADIHEKSRYIDDIKLRDIILTDEEKEFSKYSFVIEYRNNRIKYKSSVINNFINTINEKKISDIPDKVYEELDDKYLPILKKIITKSNTLGDIIDNFKIINEQINIELPFLIKTSKYNI